MIILAVESWLCGHGCGILAVQSWPRTPGCLHSGVWKLVSGVWNLELGAWSLSLESEIWSLESGDCGLRLAMGDLAGVTQVEVNFDHENTWFLQTALLKY